MFVKNNHQEKRVTKIEQAEALLRTAKKKVGEAWLFIVQAELQLKRAPIVATSKKE